MGQGNKNLWVLGPCGTSQAFQEMQWAHAMGFWEHRSLVQISRFLSMASLLQPLTQASRERQVALRTLNLSKLRYIPHTFLRPPASLV